MEVNMIDFLVGNAAIVLEEIIVGGTSRIDNFLDNRQNLAEMVIGNIGQLGTVVLRNNKSVALTERADVKKRKGLVTFKELERGNFPLDDATKNAGCHFVMR